MTRELEQPAGELLDRLTGIDAAFGERATLFADHLRGRVELRTAVASAFFGLPDAQQMALVSSRLASVDDTAMQQLLLQTVFPNVPLRVVNDLLRAAIAR